MTICQAFQIELPDAFPLVEWERFLTFGRRSIAAVDPGGEFNRAMGAVAYRYRAGDEALKSMSADWIACTQQLTFEGMYRQQRDLFEFFSCTLSAIESALYACYIVLTQRHPAAVPWGKLEARRGYFDLYLPKFLKAAGLGTHPLYTCVDALASSAVWKETKQFRNSLLHRSLPSRLIEGAVGAPPPPPSMVTYAASWSDPQLRATETQMRERLGWAAKELSFICDGGATL
jgi:hypothetical protein